MSPNSLVFVVVLAIWATYLSLYVARRREQMSTARSVDRFSAHMRVLQRRSLKAVPRSATAPTAGGRRTSILAAGALAASTATVDAPQAEQAAAVRTPAAASAKRPVAPFVPAGAGRVASLVGGASRLTSDVALRRLRAYGLLLFAAVAAVTFVLAGLSVIDWWLPIASFAGTVGLLLWLRHDRKAMLAARSRDRASRRIAGEKERRDEARVAEQEAQELAEARAQARPAAPAMPVAQEHVTPRDVPFDFAQFEEPVEAARPAARQVETDPLLRDESWEPVPVPRPTYAMKARAQNPLPPALEVPEEFDPYAAEDEFWEDDRWAVNG